MAKPEWGMKHTCQHCGALFYDLKKSPPACPKCGAQQEAEKPRARRAAAQAAAAAEAARPVPVAAVAEEPEVELELEEAVLGGDDADEEEEFIEDTADIGDDEEDIVGVIDVDGPGEKE